MSLKADALLIDRATPRPGGVGVARRHAQAAACAPTYGLAGGDH